MSAFGLAKQLGVERKQAQSYIDQYFLQYPGVKEYMESTREYAREHGYVETVYGRRLYLPDIKASNHNVRQQWIGLNNDDVKMVMQVHDELVFEVAESKLDEIENTLCQIMQDVAELKVPLVVDAGHGKNWALAH